MGDLVGDAAEQEAPGPGHALVADHDQVGLDLLGDVEDRVGRVALAGVGLDLARPRPCAASVPASSSVRLTSSRGPISYWTSPGAERSSVLQALPRHRLEGADDVEPGVESLRELESPGARPRRRCPSRRCQPRCGVNIASPLLRWVDGRTSAGRILTRDRVRASRRPRAEDVVGGGRELHRPDHHRGEQADDQHDHRGLPDRHRAQPSETDAGRPRWRRRRSSRGAPGARSSSRSPTGSGCCAATSRRA